MKLRTQQLCHYINNWKIVGMARTDQSVSVVGPDEQRAGMSRHT